jgi:hypothetical protein
MHKLAQVISWLFLPLIMPVLALVVVMFTPAVIDFHSNHSLFDLPTRTKIFFLINFLLYSLLLPAIAILLLRYTKRIDSVELDNKNQRFAPLILTSLSSFLLMYLLIGIRDTFHISAHLFGMTAAGFFVTLFFGLINLKTKISLHAGGVGMLVGFIVAYSFNHAFIVIWPIILSVLIAGMVISSRLILNKHTPKQVYLGFLLGSLITFASDLFFIYLNL